MTYGPLGTVLVQVIKLRFDFPFDFPFWDFAENNYLVVFVSFFLFFFFLIIIMTSLTFAEFDYFQFFLECWQYKDPKNMGLEHDKLRLEQAVELRDRMLSNSHIKAVVISVELSSKDNGAKGKRYHLQGVVSHDYAQRKNASEYIAKFAQSKGLNGKTADFGCMKGKMDKPLEDSIKYCLKDQGELFVFIGYSPEYLYPLRGLWIPKEHFLVEKGVKKRDGTDKPMPYCNIVARDAIEALQNLDESATKYAVAEFVARRIMKDKARLPNHMVIEVSRAVCFKLGLIDEIPYFQRLADSI